MLIQRRLSQIKTTRTEQYVISPHIDAPVFSGSDSLEIMEQLFDEVETNEFDTNETLRDMIRQLSMVNLWFFIKFVCGYAAPVDRINDGYQLEMCNFYQKHMKPGSRCYVFLGRGHGKSNIFTIYSTPWELVRNPELTIKIFNAKEDFAVGFMHAIQSVFDSNGFFGWLFPEFVPEKGRRRWNSTEMVLPNRTIERIEPNVEAGGITGASEGRHYLLIKPDDIFGMKALDSAKQAGAVMEQAKNWFKTATTSLLDGPPTARVMGAGTRWSADDGYEDIWQDCKELVGYPHEDYEPDPKGIWSIYYKPSQIDGKPINPEFFTEKFFDDLKKTDTWTSATQYDNQPSGSGLAELNEYCVNECELFYDEDKGYYIQWNEADRVEYCLLKDCNVVLACDPGASENKVSNKTSKWSAGMMAHTPCDKRILLKLYAGYLTPRDMFEWMRQMMKIFKGYIVSTCLEAQGAFKVLQPVFRDMELMANRGLSSDERVYLHVRPIGRRGQKVPFIRSTLQPLLEMGLFMCEKGCIGEFVKQMKRFPNSKQMDTLDMTTIGVNSLFKPLNEKERVEVNNREERFKNRTVSLCGY